MTKMRSQLLPLLNKRFFKFVPEAFLERGGGYFYKLYSMLPASRPRIHSECNLTLGDWVLDTPVGLSSGWADTVDKMSIAHKLGARFVTSKTITLNPRRGNPRPRIIRGERFLINSMGLPNPGVKAWIRLLEQNPPTFPWIQSIFGQSVREYIALIELLEPLVKIFELNFSCPNTEHDLPDIETAIRQIRDITSITDKPVFVKLSPSNTPKGNKKIAEKTQEHIEGLVLINTIPVQHPRLGNYSKRGGLSGDIVFPELLKHLKEVRSSFPTFNDLPIIATGGINSPRRAYIVKRDYDSIVSTITGFLQQGPRIFDLLSLGLTHACKKD